MTTFQTRNCPQPETLALNGQQAPMRLREDA
jgi:hypothetical protein